MVRKYVAPAMDEVEMTANAGCNCNCHFLTGGGGGDNDDSDRSSDIEDRLDDYYREIRKKIEQMRRKYPDYQHPDL
jgi:hypothetical protein